MRRSKARKIVEWLPAGWPAAAKLLVLCVFLLIPLFVATVWVPIAFRPGWILWAIVIAPISVASAVAIVLAVFEFITLTHGRVVLDIKARVLDFHWCAGSVGIVPWVTRRRTVHVADLSELQFGVFHAPRVAPVALFVMSAADWRMTLAEKPGGELRVFAEEVSFASGVPLQPLKRPSRRFFGVVLGAILVYAVIIMWYGMAGAP